eukprot:jgi/Botrbrau1/7180/Bobra.0300s0010.1
MWWKLSACMRWSSQTGLRARAWVARHSTFEYSQQDCSRTGSRLVCVSLVVGLPQQP